LAKEVHLISCDIYLDTRRQGPVKVACKRSSLNTWPCASPSIGWVRVAADMTCGLKQEMSPVAQRFK